MPDDPLPTDWAYAAGLVDGEGCIAVTRCFVCGRGKFCYGVTVVVSNRDRPVLEWFREKWSGLVVGTQPSLHGQSQGSTAYKSERTFR